jgi:molybdate transport system substrate-binding protein
VASAAARTVPVSVGACLIFVALAGETPDRVGPRETSATTGQAARPAAVAAAADLNVALPEIADRFARAGLGRVSLIFGSSGNLARQIHEGAPFELFLSADERFVLDLAGAGLTRDAGTLYAIGRLALFASRGSPLELDERLEGVARLLDRGGMTRFAIANPDHAPYGRAAEAVLRKRGLWERLRPHLVFGENISQAAQFAATGNAAGGLIAYSLALAPTLRARGQFVLVPEADHPPLRQRMVRLKQAGPVAERFYQFLQEPEARAILRRWGFQIPEPAGSR